jgi:hypothetical protein
LRTDNLYLVVVAENCEACERSSPASRPMTYNAPKPPEILGRGQDRREVGNLFRPKRLRSFRGQRLRVTCWSDCGARSILASLRERIVAYAASVQRDTAEDLAQEVLMVLEVKYAQVEP